MKRLGLVWLTGILLMMAVGLGVSAKCEAATKAQTIYASNPYVSMSPDGHAITLGLGRTGSYELNVSGYRGLTLPIFGSQKKEAAPKGWHYYTGLVKGSVPVGYWKLEHPLAHCTHTGDTTVFGLNRIGANARNCGASYFPGWLPYCAYCGEQIGNGYLYLDLDMAKSLKYLESGSEYSNYFYLCPYSYTLEQTGHTNHECYVLSVNRYRVQFHTGVTDASGYMQQDSFYYDNSDEYEGRAVSPSLTLSGNRFSRPGYVFAGWSTSQGGAVQFEDRQDWLTVQNVMNASLLENDAILNLYAVWRPVSSGLEVRPNGGTFRGRTTNTVLTEGYGTAVDLGTVRFSDLKVTLDGAGASEFQSKVLSSRRTFTEWQKSSPFYGSFDARKNRYTFASERAGMRDVLTAGWSADAVTLPTVTRPGYALDGWYEIRNGRRIYAGTAGDKYVPDRNVTLQAGWTAVALSLNSTPVFERRVNNGKGAVNLSWALGSDRTGISYKVYRQKQGEDRVKICKAGEYTDEIRVEKTFTGDVTREEYTVPSTGSYEITLLGASGGSHGENPGGKGGMVKLTLWLPKGKTLILETGKPGKNASNDSPATGGGATRLSLKNGSRIPTLLAVAGGGGGANESYAGGAGGSSLALRENSRFGEDAKTLTETRNGSEYRKVYASGGGEGYLGGIAGKVTYRGHVHTEEACGYHSHTGSAEEGGGCYGDRHTEKHEHSDSCSTTLVYYCGGCRWDAAQQKFVWGYCPNCGVDESNGCTNPNGKCAVMKKYNCDTSDHVTYSRNCGLEEGWQCGKDGSVTELVTSLSQTYPSGGGSNYVCDRVPDGCYILYREFDAATDYGVNSGEGKGTLTSKTIGYRTENSLKGVEAPDEASPEKVTKTNLSPAKSGKVTVSWEAPADRGTEYRFVAEAYDIASESLMAASNEVRHSMVSGISGYYVRTDEMPYTVLSAGNGSFQSGRKLTVAAGDGRTIYVHIAAVDKAGNIGETAHVPIRPDDKEVLWDVVTRQVSLQDDSAVYNAGNGDYYVRADGKSRLTFTMEAELKGTARSTYQVRSISLAERETGASLETVLPYTDPSERNVTYSGSRLEFAATGETILQSGDVASAERTGNARNARVTRELIPKAMREGEVLRVYPSAVARELTTGEEVLSDHAEDLTHGIRLIADVTAPVIYGMEQARELGTTIDRGKTPSAVVTFTAVDTGSGVDPGEFYVILTNLDNKTSRKIGAVGGKIRVELTDPEDYLFSGDIRLTVHAADRVGNVSEETVSFSEFDLETSVTRILESVDGVSTFKRGESGILHITATGYADRVEVTFPKGLTAVDPELDHVFDYSNAPAFESREDYVFMIPLYPLMKEKDSFEITVTAHKGDLVLTSHPRVHILELEGSVLDEIVTGLR